MSNQKGFQAKILIKALEELAESAKNPRTHKKAQIKKVANSITKFGFTNPILIDAEGTIVAGHCRYLAAKLLNLKEVPTICLSHLSKEEVQAYMLADNQLAIEAGWDEELLKLNFEELTNLQFDLDLTGFDIGVIDMIVLEPTKEKSIVSDKADEMPNAYEIEQKVKAGDLCKLGNHYLICGDSLKEETFKALLGELKAALIFTDGPYNVKINGHVCGKGKTTHDEFAMASGEMSDAVFTEFLRKSMQNLVKYSTGGSIHYQCMDWRHCKNMLDAADGVYAELKNICVWDKGSGGMGSLYRSQHEFIFVFKNGGEKHVNNVELGRHGRYRTNVWQYPGVRASNPDSIADLKLHPTVKNLQMVSDAVLDCSNPNDIILDAFAGSGTTLLAAEKTNRKAYVIELDPHYCDVIIYRWEQLTGKKAEFVKNIHGDSNE